MTGIDLLVGTMAILSMILIIYWSTHRNISPKDPQKEPLNYPTYADWAAQFQIDLLEPYRPASPLLLAPLNSLSPPYSPYGIRRMKSAGESCNVSDECASLACGPQDQDEKQCY